jgi:hypothetical protein
MPSGRANEGNAVNEQEALSTIVRHTERPQMPRSIATIEPVKQKEDSLPAGGSSLLNTLVREAVGLAATR